MPVMPVHDLLARLLAVATFNLPSDAFIDVGLPFLDELVDEFLIPVAWTPGLSWLETP